MSFSSRVAASLLTAQGLQGLLVVPTEEDYAAVATAAVHNAGLRGVVEGSVFEGGLFRGGGRWVQAFDRLLCLAWEGRRMRGGGVVVAE